MVRALRFHEEPMTKIWDRLYLGCYWDAEELINSNPEKIDFTLNCTPQPIAYPKKCDIMTVTLPFEDGFEIPTELFWKGIKALHEYIPMGARALVHCHAGISRSSTMVISYLWTTGFGTFDQCEAFVREKRPVIYPAPAIIRSAKQLLGIYPYGDNQ